MLPEKLQRLVSANQDCHAEKLGSAASQPTASERLPVRAGMRLAHHLIKQARAFVQRVQVLNSWCVLSLAASTKLCWISSAAVRAATISTGGS